MKKSVGRILSVLVILLAMGMTVCAVDTVDIKKNRVFQTNSDVELYEEPDTASAITATLPNGTPVIVKEDAEDGWCMVAYREDIGYVQISYLVVLGSQSTPVVSDNQSVTENGAASDDGTPSNGEAQPDDGTPSNDEVKPDDGTGSNDAAVPANASALDEEFKSVKEEGILAYQEAEAAKEQASSGRIWEIAIAVLVIAIFVVGITTTLVGNKRKKK